MSEKDGGEVLGVQPSSKTDHLMPRQRSAFTLMEVMLAIGLAVVILALAIPVLGNVIGGDPIKDSYQKFSDFVRKAQVKAVTEKRTIVLVWNKEGITMEPEVPRADDADDGPQFAFGDAKVSLDRPFALEKKPYAEWPFWRSGTCEPVRVIYESEVGKWVAEFDPLTAQGTVIEMHD